MCGGHQGASNKLMVVAVNFVELVDVYPINVQHSFHAHDDGLEIRPPPRCVR